MLLIDFDRDSVRVPTDQQVADLNSADEMDLRYVYFQSNVSLAADGLDIRRTQIPLLDFMFCLLLSALEIRGGGDGCISFTETDVVIDIVRDGSDLKILRSWDPVPGRCGVDEFITAVSRFTDDGLDFIVGRYPAFRNNPTNEKLISFRSELG